MREEAEELSRLGCTYIQVDAPDFGQLVDESQRRVWEGAGISVQRVMDEGVAILNELASVPGVTFGLHVCKGNYDSQWISSGGYESIAKHLFPRVPNYERLLLEYENERSGSFEPLSGLPDDKVVVLGLVSSKFAELEDEEQLLARIDEASKFYPRDQLALSTQCGFSSAGPGNAISEDAQQKKAAPRRRGRRATETVGMNTLPVVGQRLKPTSTAIRPIQATSARIRSTSAIAAPSIATRAPSTDVAATAARPTGDRASARKRRRSPSKRPRNQARRSRGQRKSHLSDDTLAAGGHRPRKGTFDPPVCRP
jgi:hypothetical protein